MNELEQCCETCAWAEWDYGDSTVGMSASVENCSCGFIDAETVWDLIDTEKDYKCSAYLLKHDSECLKIRCTSCNSPNTKSSKNTLPKTEKYEFMGISICKNCGTEFKHNECF